MKNNKGITLIALTVTIIVLLILATVSIATLSGDFGLITNTKESKEETEIREEKQQVNLAAVAAMSNDKWGNVTKKNLQNELNKNVGVGNFVLSGEGPFIVTYTNSNRSYEVAVNGDIKGVGSINKPEDEGNVVDTTGKWFYIINAEGYVEITGYDFSEYTVNSSDGRYGNDHYIEMGGDVLVIPETLEDPETKEQKTVVKLDWKESKLPAYQVYNEYVTSFTLIISDVKKVKYSDEIKEIYNNLNNWDIKFEAATEVKLPINLEILGDYALTGCGAESITIPDSVTEIGYAAFRESLKLKNIIIPDNVEVIGEKAFYHCEALENITLNEKITEIPYLALADTCLTEVTIPESVISIGNYAFDNCSNLTSVNIPNGVTSIGEGTFSDCSNLTSINIPNNVTSIGKYAFSGCSNLSVNIPSSETSIENNAFYQCQNVTINFLNGTNQEIPQNKWGVSKIIINGVEYNP